MLVPQNERAFFYFEFDVGKCYMGEEGEMSQCSNSGVSMRAWARWAEEVVGSERTGESINGMLRGGVCRKGGRQQRMVKHRNAKLDYTRLALDNHSSCDHV